MAKKRRLVWTQQAKADLRNIRGYIAQHAPRNADAVVRRIREQCKGLCAQAFAAPMVEEVGCHTFRETYYGSYRIMYEVTPASVSDSQPSLSAVWLPAILSNRMVDRQIRPFHSSWHASQESGSGFIAGAEPVMKDKRDLYRCSGHQLAFPVSNGA